MGTVKIIQACVAVLSPPLTSADPHLDIQLLHYLLAVTSVITVDMDTHLWSHSHFKPSKSATQCKQPAHVHNKNSLYFFLLLTTHSLSLSPPLKHLHKAIPWYVLKKKQKNLYAYTHAHTCARGPAFWLTQYPSDSVPNRTHTQTQNAIKNILHSPGRS